MDRDCGAWDVQEVGGCYDIVREVHEKEKWKGIIEEPMVVAARQNRRTSTSLGKQMTI